MRLLIITQKVDKNDAILGFFHRWIIEFAKQPHVETVKVICLQEGESDLPQNVKVLSLGKERGAGRLARVARFYSYIVRERNNYDAVFVHMNPIYVVLGGFVWNMLDKKITLWYTHKHVDVKLKIATAFAAQIFTASPESFRLKTKKLVVVGHGIDVEEFAPVARNSHERISLISVGRISPTKNQLILAQAIKKVGDVASVALSLVGGSLTSGDRAYEHKLTTYIQEEKLEDSVTLVGPVAPDTIIDWYHRADMFLNLSSTGSLDKAVLEAMACGLQILTSNEAFKNILPPENFTTNDPATIAEKIIALSTRPAPPQLREYVVQHHNLALLIPRLTGLIADK